MTFKSPLSPHLRSGTCSATRLRSIPDCSASKGLQSYNNNILNGIVIERMTCIIKLVSTMISNLNSIFSLKTIFPNYSFLFLYFYITVIESFRLIDQYQGNQKKITSIIL